MADVNERIWWRRTRLLAIFTITIGCLLGILVMLMASALDRQSVLGIPFGLLSVTLIAPLAILALIFWGAESQRRIDRVHGLEE